MRTAYTKDSTGGLTRGQVGPRRESGPSPAPRPQRKTGDEGREGKNERDLGEKKKRDPEARPTAGGFGQAYIGGFDSAGPVRAKESNKRRREAKNENGGEEGA